MKKINAVDKILNEGNDNRYENLCRLSEVKLNKTLDVLFKFCFMILSAFGAEKTSSENKAAAKRLLADIISSNHTFLPLFIGIVGKATGHEVCFLIPIKKNEDAEELKEFGKELSRRYNHELFLFAVPDENLNCRFITKWSEESEFIASNLNDIVRIYFSKINELSNGDRIFTNVYVKCTAKTINEHHARTLRGEIQIIEYGS